MYLINDQLADDLVELLDERAKSARKAAQSKTYRGRENAGTRAFLRRRADEAERAISGINTGEGVTRASARKVVAADVDLRA